MRLLGEGIEQYGATSLIVQVCGRRDDETLGALRELASKKRQGMSRGK